MTYVACETCKFQGSEDCQPSTNACPMYARHDPGVPFELSPRAVLAGFVLLLLFSVWVVGMAIVSLAWMYQRVLSFLG